MRRIVAALGLVLLAGAAQAGDRAVVIVQNGASGPAGVNGADLVQRFRAAGFTTTGGLDLTAAELPAPLSALQVPDRTPGQRVVVLVGRFVSGGGDSWLMGVDGGNPGLAAVDRAGFGLSRVVALMRDGSRNGVLLLGEAPGDGRAGPRLAPGLGETRTAAGVTIIAGPPASVAQAAAILASPRASVAAAMAASPGLRLISGGGGRSGAEAVSPPAPSLNPSPADAPAPAGAAAAAAGLSGPALPGEAEAWVLAASQNALASYQDFLAAFPNGRYAAIARERIVRLGGEAPAPAASPEASASPATTAGDANPSAGREAMLAEIALNLSLGERSQLQRILISQGFDTKGSDGLFGAATRDALRGWQKAAGLPATGYVDQTTLGRLRQAGGVR